MEAKVKWLNLLNELMQILLRMYVEVNEKSDLVFGDIYLEEFWIGCHHEDYVFLCVWANEWVQLFSVEIFEDVLWFKKTFICQRFRMVDSDIESISNNNRVIVYALEL